jgi:carnitine O-acetyltransferase
MAYPGSTYTESDELDGGSFLSASPDRAVVWKIPQKDTPMYRFQQSLPKLPVPPLEATCMKYLRTARPLLTDEEFEKTEKAVIAFLMDGTGATLHKRLLERAEKKSAEGSSWLIDWWNGLSYFGYRDPVVFYVSYFYQFIDEPANDMVQTLRGAKYVKGGLQYRELIATEKLEPEMQGKDPVDMSMYKFLFNSCRQPIKPVDAYTTYDVTYYHHIVAVRHNKFYKVDVIVDGWELSTDQIQAQLELVKKMAGNQKGEEIGLLSSNDRDSWADAKDHLVSLGDNAAAMEAIESAIMLICLDDCSPTDAESKMRNIWHGNGSNRFYDKPLQFIIAENGQAGFLGEHGMMDGTPTANFTDWLLTGLHEGKIDHSARKLGPGTDSLNSVAPPTEVRFTTDAAVSASMTAAREAFEGHVNLHDAYVLEFKAFGKDAMKKCKVSPDAFCQMAMQLAYQRIYGKPAPTYESCSVRKFLHGRTETIRSASIESVAFCNAMIVGASARDKYAKLQAAATAQSGYAREAGQGMGVDRVLLGMKLMVDASKGEEVPAIFNDKAYSESSHWRLSTSSLASEHFACWGFGEVVSDGFGCGYMNNKDNMAVVITSRHLGAEKLGAEIAKALTDMRAICEEALGAGKARL